MEEVKIGRVYRQKGKDEKEIIETIFEKISNFISNLTLYPYLLPGMRPGSGKHAGKSSAEFGFPTRHTAGISRFLGWRKRLAPGDAYTS